ncbi:uncharacterized protein LY79DRAFT_178666 [Colletotrichum navitas]|uniref:Uncharacterized protein n=1 Tax=Colletotrichum navitas TaxID=681940 RepID=A0AAD8Q0B8_9PEZI|nr:uncharacterized protein LY79DRAFT_178666 [Colletotrichum navitas]KAK1593437.1 hypothetical protein LY79DRAFT_178666 [Colletotrichum navitas]
MRPTTTTMMTMYAKGCENVEGAATAAVHCQKEHRREGTMCPRSFLPSFRLLIACVNTYLPHCLLPTTNVDMHEHVMCRHRDDPPSQKRRQPEAGFPMLTIPSTTRRSSSSLFHHYHQHYRRAFCSAPLAVVAYSRVSPFFAVPLHNSTLHPVLMDSCPGLGASINLSCGYSSIQGATAGSRHLHVRRPPPCTLPEPPWLSASQCTALLQDRRIQVQIFLYYWWSLDIVGCRHTNKHSPTRTQLRFTRANCVAGRERRIRNTDPETLADVDGRKHAQFPALRKTT